MPPNRLFDMDAHVHRCASRTGLMCAGQRRR